MESPNKRIVIAGAISSVGKGLTALVNSGKTYSYRHKLQTAKDIQLSEN
ncbi:hypothetical protein Runsl_0259 [Runella slithyformis DSM 19594]|uniref:Uncharacterized protein n=1 Tax=Runella slithyformis (strain ATCC 29530 / DSM 19594 / LMG 11500 / NCIMB 11436 / LSU 4) TaxID=761193 RepID=A0A7U4E3T2_RUNSL|nr:hypothetical protein Runsl_0259 [Runella slithyformis DSM 19594]